MADAATGRRKRFTPSAKSRRSFTCRKRCGRGRSARSAMAARCNAMQLEQVPTPQVGEDEALVLVMAAGVNYNGMWAALGEPMSRARCAQAALSRRRLRCVGHRLGRRLEGEALEAGRRSRHPLQPRRRRRRRVQWRRSDVLAVAEDLGLRNLRRLVRAILQSAGAPADAAPEASHLGRGGLLHADARDGVSHAVRLASERAAARAERAGVGRVGRAWRVRGAALRRQRRARDRRRLR